MQLMEEMPVEAINYLQINIIPILALIIMRLSTGDTLSFSWRSRALRFMMVLLTIVMIANTIGWMLDGQPSGVVHVLLWVFNTIYFILLDFMSYLWYLYVRDVLENGVGQRGAHVLKPSIPLIAFYAIMLTNPWTKIIFYIDEQNNYVRGNGFLIHSAISMGYIFVASARALYQCSKEKQAERQSECRWLAYFVILPVVGGILQVIFYGLELLLPFTAASLLMVYINVQQRQVTRDGLTGLNNRRRLDQYLLELDEQNWGSDSCHLLLMDVDRFKKINDTYGHLVGDQVLKQVAEQMKKTFGNSKAFLARYGGDEFVVILKGKSEAQVESDIKALRKSVAKINWGDGSPWKIAISVGCARYGEISMKSARELMALADARMYEEKNKNREQGN